MNNKRRKAINDIKILLLFENQFEEALDRLEEILYEEENSYYAIPENLLNSKRAEMSEDAIDNLSEAIDILSGYVDNIDKNLKLKKDWEKVSRDVLLQLNRIY